MKQVIWAIAALLLVSGALAAQSLEEISVYVAPKVAGDRQPNTAFTYEINFTTSSDCSGVLYSNTSSVTTDDEGIGLITLNLTTLTTVPSYACEYRDGVLQQAHYLNKNLFRITPENGTSGWNLTFIEIFSDDWSNVTITESQITDLSHTTNCNASGSCADNDVAYMDYSNTGEFNVSEGFHAGDQSTFFGGNGKIVTTNGAGAAGFTSSTGGTIDFSSNTAAIGISGDGVSGGYDYDGTFVFKQKASNPDGPVEFLFIEEAGDWRFALPSSGVDYGTYNPRSLIVAGPSTNNASAIECSYWGFNKLDCDTGGTGADLGVQDDLQVLGTIFADDWSNVTIDRLTSTNSELILTDDGSDMTLNATLGDLMILSQGNFDLGYGDGTGTFYLHDYGDGSAQIYSTGDFHISRSSGDTYIEDNIYGPSQSAEWVITSQAADVAIGSISNGAFLFDTAVDANPVTDFHTRWTHYGQLVTLAELEVDGVFKTTSNVGGTLLPVVSEDYTVTAGTGLSGGGDFSAGGPTLNVGASTGITTSGSSVSVTDTYRLPQGCGDGQQALWNSTSSLWYCAADGSGGGGAAGKEGDGVYLYNDSTVMYLNETVLNATIDARDDYVADTNCNASGSCSENYVIYGDANNDWVQNTYQTSDTGTSSEDVGFFFRTDALMDQTYSNNNDVSYIAVFCEGQQTDPSSNECEYKFTNKGYLRLRGFYQGAYPLSTNTPIYANYIFSNLGLNSDAKPDATMHINAQRDANVASNTVSTFFKMTDQASNSQGYSAFGIKAQYIPSDVTRVAHNVWTGRYAASEIVMNFGGDTKDFSSDGGSLTHSNLWAEYQEVDPRTGGGHAVTTGGLLNQYLTTNDDDTIITNWYTNYVDDFSNMSTTSYTRVIEPAIYTPGARKQTDWFQGDEWDEGGTIYGSEHIFTQDDSLRIKTGGDPSSGEDYDVSINATVMKVNVPTNFTDDVDVHGTLTIHGPCVNSTGESCQFADLAEFMATEYSRDHVTCVEGWIEEVVYYERVPIQEERESIECHMIDDYSLVEECWNRTYNETVDQELIEKTREIIHPVECSFTGELEFEDGDPVCIDPNDPFLIAPCTNKYSKFVVGSVSYNATAFMGVYGVQGNVYPVAGAMNVPIKTDCTNPVSIGDELVTGAGGAVAQARDYTFETKQLLEWEHNADTCRIWVRENRPAWGLSEAVDFCYEQIGDKPELFGRIIGKAAEACSGGTEVIRAWI